MTFSILTLESNNFKIDIMKNLLLFCGKFEVAAKETSITFIYIVILCRITSKDITTPLTVHLQQLLVNFQF